LLLTAGHRALGSALSVLYTTLNNLNHMDKQARIYIVALRMALGWLFFYAGITKLVNPAWSAAPYISAAKTFGGLYSWFTTPGVIDVVNVLNEWGLTLIGVSLIVGAFVRVSSVLGVVLMVLYYLPILDFPTVGAHGYIVDEHVIYAAALLVLYATKSGHVCGADVRLKKITWLKKVI